MRKNVTESNIFRNSLFGIFLSLTFFCGWASAQVRSAIHITAETTIETETVSLGDIAHISGSNHALVSRLKSISLGYSPNVGMIREVYRDKILLSIAASGILKTEFTLDSPAKITILRLAHIVDNQAIRLAVEKAIFSDFEKNNVRAKIVRLEFPENLQVPAGDVEIRVLPISASNLFAPFSVSIEIRIDEKVVRRIPATVQIEASMEVLVASKDMVSGDKLTEADVKKETRLLTKPFASYLRDSDRLHGKILIRNLAAGNEITSDSFASGYVVRSGETIRILGESGKMQIVISGEARSSGRIGDRISVKNSQSGTMLQAVVIDEGLVKIIF